MKSYCPYCMKLISSSQFCPFCGKDVSKYTSSSHHLRIGTKLKNQYIIGRVLGEGGFGITYLGLDTNLERIIAIKEYFPTAFVKRETSLDTKVTCYTDVGKVAYEKGKSQFIQEARIIARLDYIPEIVRVMDYFQENNTAYIVMEYLKGKTLKQLADCERIPIEDLLQMLKPLFQGMQVMHQAGLIHRDISPDNLIQLNNKKIKLMDFGCARDLEGGHTMTVVLKHSYAPIEQYTGHDQGPWTDIYALCATIYYCLTQKLPPRALTRKSGSEDELIPPRKLGAALTAGQEKVLLKGLAVQPCDRWQSIEEFYEALYGQTMGQPVRESLEFNSASSTNEKNGSSTEIIVPMPQTNGIMQSSKGSSKQKKSEPNDSNLINNNGSQDVHYSKINKVGIVAAIVCFIVLIIVAIGFNQKFSSATPPSLDASLDNQENNRILSSISEDGIIQYIVYNSDKQPKIDLPESELQPDVIYDNLVYIPEMFYGRYQLLGTDEETQSFCQSTDEIIEYSEYSAIAGGNKTKDLAAMPIMILAGPKNLNISRENLDIGNRNPNYLMRVSYKDKYTEELIILTCCYEVEGRKLKLWPLQQNQYIDGIMTYKVDEVFFEYEFEFSGTSLTLKRNGSSVTLNAGYNYGTEENPRIYIDAYRTPGSEQLEDIVAFHLLWDTEENGKYNRFYVSYINRDDQITISYDDTAILSENGLFTFTHTYLEGEQKVLTYQYVYFLCKDDGIILTDGINIYQYSVNTFEYKEAVLNGPYN